MDHDTVMDITCARDTAGNALQPVVFVKDKAVFANSRDVAAFFEKRHAHVLRNIDEFLIAEPDWADEHFRMVMYEGENGNHFRSFDMTRDGFAFLVMEFKGEKARKFKIRYIEAYNQMEARLNSAAPMTTRLSPDMVDRIANGEITGIVSYVNTVRHLYGKSGGRKAWVDMGMPDYADKYQRPATEDAEALDCLHHLLGHVFTRWKNDDITVGAAVRMIYAAPAATNDLHKRLCKCGMRVGYARTPDVLAVANFSDTLTRIYKDTAWDHGRWRDVLRQIDGVSASTHAMRFGPGVEQRRGTLIPLSLIVTGKDT